MKSICNHYVHELCSRLSLVNFLHLKMYIISKPRSLLHSVATVAVAGFTILYVTRYSGYAYKQTKEQNITQIKLHKNPNREVILDSNGYVITCSPL